MKSKLVKIAGIGLALMLLVSMLVSVIPVSAATLQYTAVGMPTAIPFNTVRTNVSLDVFAMAPNGKTMFVYDNTANVLLRSTGSGTSWSTANIGVGLPAGVDLVDIAVSPSYDTDSVLVAVTAAQVYRSINGGANFGQIGTVVLPSATAVITSVDITDYYLGGQAILISYADFTVVGGLSMPFGGVQLFTMTDLAWTNQQCTRTAAETLILRVTTAIDAANPATVTVTYTDQSSVAGNVATAAVIPAGSGIGTEVAIVLAAGDTGAVDVTAVSTVGSLATSGAFMVRGGLVAAPLDNYGSYLITAAAAGTFTDAGVGHSLNVLSVAFSPNHRVDALMVALATDGTNTYMLYKMGSEVWSATVQTASMTTVYPNATYGTLAFPADFDWSGVNKIVASVATPAAITANDDIYLVTGGLAAGSSSFKRLNVRGTSGGPIAIRSIALEGNYVGGNLMVGAYLSATTTLVYTATDPSTLGSNAWPQSIKQPIGSYTAGQYATVAFSPISDDAYAMTQGACAAFSKSIDSGVTWNGISLLNISAAANVRINDFVTSDTKTMYVILFDDRDATTTTTPGDFSLLLKSTNGGSSWQQVWARLTQINESFTRLGISPTYDKDSVIYVAQNDTRIWKSSTGGTTFIGLTSPGTNISAFYVLDANTYYTGAAGTSPAQGFYKSGRWTSPVLSASVVDIALSADGKTIYIGYNNGTAAKSLDDGVTFSTYATVGAGDVNVTPDADGNLYATTSGVTNTGIWRLNNVAGAVWVNLDAAFIGTTTTAPGAAIGATAADAVTATFTTAGDVLNVAGAPGTALTVTVLGNTTWVYNNTTNTYTITCGATVPSVVTITNTGTGPAAASVTTPAGNTGTVTFAVTSDSDLDVTVPGAALGPGAGAGNISLPDIATAASTGTVNVTTCATDLYLAKNGTLYVSYAGVDNTGAWSGGGMRRTVNPKGATVALRNFQTIASAPGFDLPATATGMKIGNSSIGNDIYMIVGNVPAGSLSGQGYALTAGLLGNVGARVAYFGDTAAVAIKTLDPKDNVITTGTSVSLSWSKVDAPVTLTYSYQIGTDPDFANLIDLDNNSNNGTQTELTTTGTSVTIFGLVPGTQYWWRVRIVNAGGENNPISGMWSTRMSFTAELGGPTLKSPEYGAVDVALRPTFSWLGITGAEGYELQMATNQFFAMPTVKGPLSHTTWTWEEDLTYGTTYYWRVRAIKGGTTYSPWSESVFTIGAEPTPAAAPVVVTQAAAAPVPTIIMPTPTVIIPSTEAPAPSPITPAVIWAIIIIGAILVIAVIVLIVRTRRVP